MHSAIGYNAENVSYTLRDKRIVSAWIQKIIRLEGFLPGNISFIFCDDKYLIELNKKYLKHKTLTDIITFNYCEEKFISGDIFISIERVKDNAKSLKTKYINELHRVMCHGILHLIGYNDKKNSESLDMRAKEDKCLLLISKIKKRST